MIVSDYMELGDSGLIPTPYGFFNTITRERLGHDGLPLFDEKDKNENTKKD